MSSKLKIKDNPKTFLKHLTETAESKEFHANSETQTKRHFPFQSISSKHQTEDSKGTQSYINHQTLTCLFTNVQFINYSTSVQKIYPRLKRTTTFSTEHLKVSFL